MKHLHEKSPCCRGKIRRFGGRRRQCFVCHRTWTVWKKKRGAKRKRQSFDLLFKYFSNRRGPLRKPFLRARVRKTLEAFIQQKRWARIPSGQLTAIADAMMQKIDHKLYSFHFILLKSNTASWSVITQPSMFLGAENNLTWIKAFSKLPKPVLARIEALVCDGKTSLINLGKRKGWLVQRCHFHLRARIANYSRFSLMSQHPKTALRINQLVTIILTSKREKKVKEALLELTMLKDKLTYWLGRVISSFSKNFIDYRTYLDYSTLNLPTTTNAVESMIGSIRELQHRARGFSSINSLKKWIEGYLKYRRFWVCNGHKNQQN